MQQGYGEITYHSLEKLVREMLKCAVTSEDDVWIDLGSGFGATLPQISYLTGARTIGVEGQPFRSSTSLKLLHEFRARYWNNAPVLKVLDRCLVFERFIEKVNGVVPNGEEPITHIYTFDYVMSQESKDAILSMFQDCPHIKCLATTQNEQAVFNVFGLSRQFFTKVTGVSCSMKGCAGSS